MDRKVKITIIVMAVLIVVLIVVGVLSFSKYNGKRKTNQLENNDEIYDSEGVVLEGSEEMINLYSSWEEVLNKIQEEYVEDYVEVTFEKEESDCWYYTDSLANEYVYCMADPRIIKIEKNIYKSE